VSGSELVSLLKALQLASPFHSIGKNEGRHPHIHKSLLLSPQLPFFSLPPSLPPSLPSHQVSSSTVPFMDHRNFSLSLVPQGGRVAFSSGVGT